MASTSKRKKAIERALALSEEYDVVLSSILIGNNLVNIACTSIATLVFTGFFGQQLGTTLSTVVMTIIVLIFGEVTPKQIAKEKAESYAIAVALQIYFDFSGYSDMAIGLGRMMGFYFPENFRYPFISGSISEFWRRWHITLGSWFRD